MEEEKRTQQKTMCPLRWYKDADMTFCDSICEWWIKSWNCCSIKAIAILAVDIDKEGIQVNGGF